MMIILLILVVNNTSYTTCSHYFLNACCRYVEIFKSSMLEAESAIAMQGKYIPGMGASGGGRPTPYDRRGRGMRGARGVAGVGRGRGGGTIKGLMGI